MHILFNRMTYFNIHHPPPPSPNNHQSRAPHALHSPTFIAAWVVFPPFICEKPPGGVGGVNSFQIDRLAHFPLISIPQFLFFLFFFSFLDKKITQDRFGFLGIGVGGLLRKKQNGVWVWIGERGGGKGCWNMMV